MQIEYLREFVAVVDEGSMCHAARKLFITQSVLSKHMQNLEKEFDSQLFMRTATGIRPTPLGHKAYSAFCSIIDEYDDEAGLAIGRTKADSPEIDGKCYVETLTPYKPGDFVKVRITGSEEYDLVGTPEDEVQTS